MRILITAMMAALLAVACGPVRGGGDVTPTPTDVIPIDSATPSLEASPSATTTAPPDPDRDGTAEQRPVSRTVVVPSTGLRLTLRMPASRFADGEPITARLVVENVSDRPVGVLFPDGCGEHIFIQDARGRRGGPGIGCSDVITPFTFEPGRRTVTDLVWSDAEGDDPARPGRYSAIGAIPGWRCDEIIDDPDAIPDACYERSRLLEPAHRTPPITFTVA